MSISDVKDLITQNTPTAVLLAVCSGAFVGGRAYENLSLRIDTVEARRSEDADDEREWRTAQLAESRRITEVLQDLAVTSRDNKRRIDAINGQVAR